MLTSEMKCRVHLKELRLLEVNEFVVRRWFSVLHAVLALELAA